MAFQERASSCTDRDRRSGVVPRHRRLKPRWLFKRPVAASAMTRSDRYTRVTAYDLLRPQVLHEDVALIRTSQIF